MSLNSVDRQSSPPPSAGLYLRGGKRLFDLLVAVILLPLLSPVFIIVGVLIKLESRGPVFYRQRRAGKNGDPFEILKFRTMWAGRNENGPAITSADDVRLTRFGRILRRWKLDEIPQLWNVLLGDMSLVGPRPDTLSHVAQYSARQLAVLRLRPGITSLASVCHREEAELLTQAEDKESFYTAHILPRKMLLDERYMQNLSFALDLRILLLTIVLLLFPSRSRTPSLRLFPLLFDVHGWALQIATDMGIFLLSFYLAFWFRFEDKWPPFRTAQFFFFIPIMPFGRWLVNRLTGVYNSVWRHFAEGDALLLALSNLVCSFALLALRLFFPLPPEEFPYLRLPLSVILAEYVLTTFGMIAVRTLRKILYESDIRYQPPKSLMPTRIVIVGAGRAAMGVVGELQGRSEYEVVGFVEDDPRKSGAQLHGLRVLGTTSQVPAIVRDRQVDVVLFSPDAPQQLNAESIHQFCDSAGVVFVTVPSLPEILEASLAKRQVLEAPSALQS